MAITVEMRTQVSQLYVALFGRAPDGEGLAYWVGLLNAGQSMEQVGATMYATEPARSYYPGYLTNEEIIESFYVNVLGRNPDAEGLAYWTGKLNAVGATPASVLVEMIDVVANYTGTDPAGVESAALFNNRVEVAQWYGEENGSIEGATAILDDVTSDPATVDAVIEGGVAQNGQTFALTVNQDNFTGTAGNDTFNAAAAQDGAGALINTLQNVDVLNGGDGTDTLNVTEAEDATITATLAGIEQVNARFAGTSGTGEISLASATGVTTVTVANSPVAGTVSGLAKIANIGVQNQNADVKFSDSTATSLNISVNTVGDLDAAIGDIVIDLDDAVATTHALTLNNVNVEITEAVDSATTLSVAATGENLVKGSAYSTVTGLTVTGAGSVEFDAATILTALKTVNAAGNTGGVTLKAEDALTTVTGGDGNDSVTADDLAAKSSFTMGAGDDTVTLDAIAAETTVSLGDGADSFTVGAADQKMTVTGGAGNDTINISARNGTTNAISIKGEAGDDTINVGAGALGADDVVDGGDGTDTLAITSGENFTADYVNFEALEIGGASHTTTTTTTIYDLSVDTDIKNVYLTDTALVDDVLLDNAAVGVAITVGTGDADLATTKDLTFDLKTDGASDTLTLTLVTNDDADKSVAGDGDDSLNDVTLTKFVADDIETLTIVASATNVDGGAGATEGTYTAADYVQTITKLDAADLVTLNISGNASLVITDIDNATALKAVDASDSEGSVTVNLGTSGTTAAVSYFGAEGVDTVTASANSDLLQGNGGADVFVLGAGDDTVRLAAQADSKLVLNDSDADGAADEISGFDIVDGFTAGADQIELATALYGAATAGQKADVLNAGTFGDNASAYFAAGGQALGADADAFAAALETFLGDGVDFFAASPTVDRSVAFAVVDGATDDLLVFIDVNNDGNFSMGADSVIALTGVTSLAIGDVAFG